MGLTHFDPFLSVSFEGRGRTCDQVINGARTWGQTQSIVNEYHSNMAMADYRDVTSHATALPLSRHMTTMPDHRSYGGRREVSFTLKNEPHITSSACLGARPKTNLNRNNYFSDSSQENEEMDTVRNISRKTITKQRSLKEIGDQIDSLVQVVQTLATSQEKQSVPAVTKPDTVITTGSTKNGNQ